MTLFSWRERAIASMLLLSSFLAYGPRAYAAPRDIYLAEIGWAGSFISTADEWIEVANRSGTAIDISGWSLIGAATGGAAITFPVGSVIQPHDVFLIANYAATHASSTLNETPDLITTSVSLPNDKQLLTLLDGEGLEIDRAGDDTTPLAGDSVTRAAMKRVDAHIDGGTEEAWKTAELSQGFDARRTELGTPGIYEELTMVIEESPIIVTPIEEPVIALEPEVIPETIPDDPVVTEPPAETIPEIVPTEEVATTEPETIPETVTEPTTESEATSGVVIEPEPILEPLPVTPPTVETPTTTSQTSSSSSPTPYTPPPTPSVPQPIRVTAPLKINELVSDPVTGAKEWVELVNPTDHSVTLTGWVLTEGGGASHDLSSHTIAAQGFLVIEDPAGALNNDTDTVMLIDPFGVTIDHVTYGTTTVPTTKDPESLARNSAGAWVKTETPTKGAVNVIHVTAVATQTNTSTTTTSTSANTTTSSQTTAQEDDEDDETVPSQETDVSSNPLVALGTLTLSEILADPEGMEATDEFIELFYIGTETRDAGGWMLEDGSRKRFTIPVGTMFVPDSYYTFFRTQTSIALNNTNETITLLAPDGTEADQKTYERSKEGTSLAYLDGQWLDQGEPTPNEPNRVSTPSVASDGSSAVSSSANSSSSTTPKGSGKNPGTLHAVTLAAALTLPDNTHVSLEGTVTAAPGMLGRQIAYMQMDGAAIQLYRNDGVFPAFTLGDRVKVVGVLSTIRGERRLKLDENGLTLNGVEDLSPTKMTIKDAIAKGGGGAFIEIEATLFSKSGQKIVLEQDGAQIAAVVPDGTSAPALGSRVRVRGIASTSTGTLRLLPRTAKDIEVMTPEAAGAVLSTDKPTTPSGTRIAPGMILLGITILATAGFAVRHYFSKYTYGKYPSLRFSTQKSH